MTDSNVLDSPITTSHCKVCLETKPVSEFYLNNGRPRAICKQCHSAACAQRHREKRAKGGVTYGALAKSVGTYGAFARGSRTLKLRARLEAKRQPLPPIRPQRVADVVPLMVTLAERAPNGCAYPYGESGDYRFCGHPRVEKQPYCQPHCDLCYRPDETKDFAAFLLYHNKR
jgi:hypothetical protein